jgi:ubiquinone/menaquinone biosynthesis C-methylase UbiE
MAPMPTLHKKIRKLRNISYTSSDLDSPLAMVKTNIQALSFADSIFDCLMCNHVLEHVPDDRKAMNELFRVLKPGGWAIIQSAMNPNIMNTFEDPSIVSPQDRARLFGQEDHLRIYGKDYGQRLEEAGFSVKVDDFVRQLEPLTISRYGVIKDELIYICSKTPGNK